MVPSTSTNSKLAVTQLLIALDVVRSDGDVSDAEIRALEALAAAVGLPAADVLSKL